MRSFLVWGKDEAHAVTFVCSLILASLDVCMNDPLELLLEYYLVRFDTIPVF